MNWPFHRAVSRYDHAAGPAASSASIFPNAMNGLCDFMAASSASAPLPQIPSPTSIPAVQPATALEEIPVSFITTIENDAKTFAAWAEKELGKLSTEAPTIAKTTDSILTYVGGAASIIAGLEGGPAASAAVTTATSAIQSGVIALSGLVTDFGATPTAASISASLATNASALLAAAQVKNPASVTAATAIVSNLNSLATALTAAIPPPPALTPAAEPAVA